MGQRRTHIEIFFQKSALEMNSNENATYQNLWAATKAVLIGKTIA